MAYPLIVSPEAEAELARAHEWYDEQSAGLGSEFSACVDEVFSRIQRTPRAFAEAYKNVRQTLVPRFPFVVWGCRNANRTSFQLAGFVLADVGGGW